MARSTEIFRTPDERFDALPDFNFEPHYLDLLDDLSGLRMHLLDEGEGAPIVLLHGDPTWAYLYRKMIPELAEEGRVIVPDLVGFGRSDKPLDRNWYSYERHCDSIVQLIGGLDLRDITLIVHDWGGPIGLRIAIEDPSRFARLVILNTGIFRPGPGWPSAAFLAWREFAEQNHDLPVGSLIQAGTVTDLQEDVVAAYEAPFPTADSKAGAAVFPLLIPLSEDDPGAGPMFATREALSSWNGPVLVAFGDSDPIFTPRVGERWVERIPGAGPLVAIGGASHFLQEDAGEQVAGEIVRFINATR